MNFTEWLYLNEMAYFTVPDGIDLEVPCDDGTCKPYMIDMRFEDPPAVIDKATGKPMGQWSKFMGKIPSSGKYFVYDGTWGLRTKPIPEDRIYNMEKNGYNLLDDDWWERAILVGHDGEMIGYPKYSQGRL